MTNPSTAQQDEKMGRDRDMSDHTPAPWPAPDQPTFFFTGKGGTESALRAGILSLSDYLHARQCVNERSNLADALQKILGMCDEICRAGHENRNAYYSAGEIGDVARAALASLPA